MSTRYKGSEAVQVHLVQAPNYDFFLMKARLRVFAPVLLGLDFSEWRLIPPSEKLLLAFARIRTHDSLNRVPRWAPILVLPVEQSSSLS